MYDRMIWGRLSSHIDENPVETEVDLITRRPSVCVNIQNYAMYVFALTQRTLCVAYSIIMKSQAPSSIALVNYSKILPQIYTTLNILENFI
jgi:hypothetical protein